MPASRLTRLKRLRAKLDLEAGFRPALRKVVPKNGSPLQSHAGADLSRAGQHRLTKLRKAHSIKR